ncbi:hypothetical protein GQ457_08G022800 [Hibiscus cannabinus]
MVSTPLHRGRQDLVVDGVHSTPPRETRLGCKWCPLHSTEGDKTWLVDAIVGVSTPLHRGRQDLVVDGVHSTPPRET